MSRERDAMKAEIARYRNRPASSFVELDEFYRTSIDTATVAHPDPDPLDVTPDETITPSRLRWELRDPALPRFREQRRRSRWGCSVALLAIVAALVVFWVGLGFVAVNVFAGYNERAGTSSQPDTVSPDARCASPTAGVVLRGGLDHAEVATNPGHILGSRCSGGAVSRMAGGQVELGLRSALVSGQDVECVPAGLDAGPQPDPAGTQRPAHLRQPGLLRTAAPVSGDTQRQPAGCLGQGQEDSPVWAPELTRPLYAGSGSGDASSSCGGMDVPSDRGSVPDSGHGGLGDCVGQESVTRDVNRALPAAASQPAGTLPVSVPAKTSGVASWYEARGYQGAVPWWRPGQDPVWAAVSRFADGRTYAVTVLVTGACQCLRGTPRERVIDLSPAAFSQLAPLSVGLIRVTVEVPVQGPRLPATDAEAVQ